MTGQSACFARFRQYCTDGPYGGSRSISRGTDQQFAEAKIPQSHRSLVLLELTAVSQQVVGGNFFCADIMARRCVEAQRHACVKWFEN